MLQQEKKVRFLDDDDDDNRRAGTICERGYREQSARSRNSPISDNAREIVYSVPDLHRRRRLLRCKCFVQSSKDKQIPYRTRIVGTNYFQSSLEGE